MRAILIGLVALLAIGCGSSPLEPTRTYTAAFSVTRPIVGDCVDVHCTYTAIVTNIGPDCASTVGMSISLTAPPLFPVMSVGVAVPGVMRPNQSIQVTGSDWPKNAVLLTSANAKGVAIACP